MRKDKKSRKPVYYNIPMTMACVLFCLTLFTTHFTGGLYARYTATDTADDAARVAKFSVKHLLKENAEERTQLNVVMVPGQYKYTVDVTNNSEVDVNCTITLENTTDNLPLQLKVYKEGASDVEIDAATAVYSGNLDANSGTTTYVLCVTFPQENANSYINMLDVVEFSVLTEQID